MKIFQIVNDFCYNDVTMIFPTVASTIGKFPSSVLFVEAPDYVFEGWGYMDGEFIKPTPPEGFLYDAETGTFYPEGTNPSSYKSPTQLRELAYTSEAIIEYEDKNITVDEANKFFIQYFAEGNIEKTSILQEKIIEAKAIIRAKYPDEM